MCSGRLPEGCVTGIVGTCQEETGNYISDDGLSSPNLFATWNHSQFSFSPERHRKLYGNMSANLQQQHPSNTRYTHAHHTGGYRIKRRSASLDNSTNKKPRGYTVWKQKEIINSSAATKKLIERFIVYLKYLKMNRANTVRFIYRLTLLLDIELLLLTWNEDVSHIVIISGKRSA